MTYNGTLARPTPRSGALGFLQYTATRLVVLLFTVAATVYITILIANAGGQVDDFIKGDIDFAIGMSMRGLDVTAEEKEALFDERREAAYEAVGLNTPFPVRCFRWLKRGLTLDWGTTRLAPTGRWSSREREIRGLIAESLPRTLLIFGASNLLLFIVTVLVALPLTNKQVDWIDRVIITLSPLSAAPAWVYGVVLNLFMLRTIGGALSGGAFDAWPDEFKWAYVPMLLRNVVLPLLSIFLSGLFQGIYTWRTYFQLHADEDYVELARAKGLSSGRLSRLYILKPMLPSLITSFALIFVSLWQEVIILEQYFNVVGIGALFARVIGWSAPGRTPFIVALVSTFAYLLAITVFVLDIAYAIVDPRIRVTGQGTTVTSRQSVRSRRVSRRVLGAWAWRVLRARARYRTADTPAHRFTEAGVTATVRRPARPPTVPWWRRQANRLSESVAFALRQLPKYPAALIGLLIITGMIITSIYTVIAIPYDEMLLFWRDGEAMWTENPKNAWPVWINRFRDEQLPETIRMDSGTDTAPAGLVTKTVEAVSDEMTEITLTFPFAYKYDALPQEVAVHIDTAFREKRPLVTLTWVRPDGVEIKLMSKTLSGSTTYRVSQDDKLSRKLGGEEPLEALLYDPYAYVPVIEQGVYKLRVSAYVFEDDADVEAKLIVFGQVFGPAGTDDRRRDLSVPLLWGMSVALAFGLLAAIGTTISSVLIAAVGTWIGGWVDIVVQRITEVNMILPFLPVSIMVFVLYSKSIWVILGVTVLLSIFGSSIKNYRALFLQVRESPYIEAARCYGAGHGRIIIHYLIPRIVSVLIPQVVILVPSYVFLEASLAFLGVSDPVLPTWGKLIVNGLARGLYSENYHLILEPLALLMLVSFAFVMVGMSLQRIFKPTVRFT